MEGNIAVQIYKIYNKHWSTTILWNGRFKSFEEIFDYFTKNLSVKFRYFYYDIHNNCNLYLNGQKKK